MFKADLTQREVETPSNHWCASGHCAPLHFRRNGPGSPDEPTRFYQVTTEGINAIYCEPCLIIAHWMSKQQKKE